jgi:hypothetical protein
MQEQRSRPWRFAALGVLMVIFGVLGGGAGPAGAAVTVSDGETVAGISVDEVVSALADNHVAVLDSTASESDLAAIAADARSKGLNLWIVSLSKRLTNDDAKQLAELIRARLHGTVLVLSPTAGGQDSDELSGSQQADAQAAAIAAGSDDVAAARAYLESATAKGFPWPLVIIGMLVLVVIGAIAYGLIRRNRKKSADHEALADLTKGLQNRLQVLAPLMLTITSRIGLVDRPDLADRFNRAGADYTRLGGEVATPLTSRAEVDRAAAEVATVEKTLDDIDRQLDALLPGLEGPSPAG